MILLSAFRKHFTYHKATGCWIFDSQILYLIKIRVRKINKIKKKNILLESRNIYEEHN